MGEGLYELVDGRPAIRLNLVSGGGPVVSGGKYEIIDGALALRAKVVGGSAGGGGITQAQLDEAISASQSVLQTQINTTQMIGTPYNHAPIANTAAVVALPATPQKRWAIYQIEASYGTMPTGGLLTISEGGAEKYRLNITASGAAPTVAGRRFAANTAIVVTLAAGGAGVSGALNLAAELVDA